MIMICTPTRDNVSSGFVYDLTRLLKHSPEVEFSVSLGTLLPNQRTELVNRSIASHFGHVLFIDSDMRFPPDTVERLMKHKLDIVGANCKHRQADKWTIGKSSKGKKGLEEVDIIGFGVTLIRTAVFLKMPPPWFATPFDGFKFVTDDVFFCRKAKEHGFKIFADHDISQDVKHSGTVDFGV